MKRMDARKHRGWSPVFCDGREQVLAPDLAKLAIQQITAVVGKAMKMVDAICAQCGDEARTIPILVGEPECLCLGCAEQARRATHTPSTPSSGEPSSEEQAAHAARLERTGLAGRAKIIEALGLAPDGGELDTKRPQSALASRAVVRYLASTRARSTLVLAGPSGRGKTIAAAWAAWESRGSFWPRSQWSRLGRREASADADWLARAPGVVVLDDVLAVGAGSEAKDASADVEVLFRIVGDRHEAGLATILTTQADERELELAYGSRGSAILRRAKDGQDLSGAPESGGFVWCVPTRTATVRP